jgi:hypothetical protein
MLPPSTPRVQHGIRRLGSLDALHPATADPFRTDLTGFVPSEAELATAATELGPDHPPERGALRQLTYGNRRQATDAS